MKLEPPLDVLREELMRLAPSLTNVDQVMNIIARRFGPVLGAASDIVDNAARRADSSDLARIEEIHIRRLESALIESAGAR